jgi:hypothetical protein
VFCIFSDRVYLYDLERHFFLLHSYGKTVILKYNLKIIFSEHRSEPSCLSGEVSCGLLDTGTVSSRIEMQAGLRKQNALKKAGFFRLSVQPIFRWFEICERVL